MKKNKEIMKKIAPIVIVSILLLIILLGMAVKTRYFLSRSTF